jgi:hypothetical protein
MFVKLSEAKAAIGGDVSDESAISIAAGISESLSKACNRVFPRLVESIAISGSRAVVTSYWHGLHPGDRIRVNTMAGGTPLDIGDVTVGPGGYSRDTFEIETNASAFDPAIAGTITFRKVRMQVFRTRGEPSVFVPWRPLESVLKLEVRSSSDVWEEVPADEFAISGEHDGLSLTGEVERIGKAFPCGRDNAAVPNGARVTYVAGDPFVSPDILYATINLIAAATDRNKRAEFQSQSYDYYSYSRMSSSEIGKLFGEADRIVMEYKIPV